MTFTEALSAIFDDGDQRQVDWNWFSNASSGWSDGRWVIIDGKVVIDLQEDK